MSLGERLKNSWNAFLGRDQVQVKDRGYVSSRRPDIKVLSKGIDRTIVTAIYNRIAMDVAAVNIRHVIVDDNGNFRSPYDESKLSEALSTSANIDQTGRELIQDLVLSMFDEGVVAVVPVDCDRDPFNGAFDPITLRTGQILAWYPKHVKVRLYNDSIGQKQDIIMPKSAVAIITNPLYSVMNQPNSTLQRLIQKLTILDAIDEKTKTGKFDMIVQLPYAIKTEQRREEATKRIRDLETQLRANKYGIAYTDASEKIQQLNSPLENNLMEQIEFLTSMLYGQLGISKEVFEGTADERVMLNYNNRTILPILTAITEEFTRKFLTPNARTRNQRIKFMQEPFRPVAVSQMAEIADKFIRSQILSPNELRGITGFRPVDDPKADELRNTNLNESAEVSPPASTNPEINAANQQMQGQEQMYMENQNGEQYPQDEGGDAG